MTLPDLPGVTEDDWADFESRRYDRATSRRLGTLDFDESVDRRLDAYQPIRGAGGDGLAERQARGRVLLHDAIGGIAEEAELPIRHEVGRELLRQHIGETNAAAEDALDGAVLDEAQARGRALLARQIAADEERRRAEGQFDFDPTVAPAGAAGAGDPRARFEASSAALLDGASQRYLPVDGAPDPSTISSPLPSIQDVPPWERTSGPMSRSEAHAQGLQAAQQAAQAERDLGRQRMAERRQAADEYAFYGAQDERDRRTLETAMRIPILGGILRAGMGLEKRVGKIEEEAGAASSSMTRPGASAVERGIGALGLAGTAFGTPGSLSAGMAEGAGASPAAAGVVGAAVNFASPFGGASTLANLQEMGAVGRTAIPLLSSTVAVGAGTKAYWESKDAGDDDRTAWLKAMAAAINAGDAALGVTEFGRAGALGLRDAAANVVGKGVTAEAARRLNLGFDEATVAANRAADAPVPRAPALAPEPAAAFVESGARSVSQGIDWGTDSSFDAFTRAMADPAKREALLRAAAGNPTRAEETAGQIGTVAGGLLGGASGDENTSLQERAFRAFTGMLAGSQAGVRFPRLASAVKGAADDVASADRLGVIADVLGAPATDARGRILSRAERAAAGGERVLPPLQLSKAGEATRQKWIDAQADQILETQSGISPSNAVKLATQNVDRNIERLQRAGRIPEEMLGRDERGWLARRADELGTYARLNLLLSPLTHLRNIAGTAATAPWQFAEGMLAPALEPMWRALGREADPRYFNEVPARAVGMGHAWAAAGKNLLDVLRHGDDALEAAQTGRRSVGRVERALAVGFRPLSAVDVFFKTVYEGGELYAQAYRRARQAGLKGDALRDELLRLVEHPDEAMVAAVEERAKYATYNADPDRLGRVLQRLSNVPVLGPTIAPFVRTPLNAIKYDLERSPLGVVSVAKGAFDASTTSGEMADRTARALLGSSLAFGLYQYAKAGGITGPMPATPTEREAWEQEGKRPWSIRIGDSWYDLRILPGLGGTVAIAAGVADAERRVRSGEMTFQQAAARYSLHMAKVLASKPLLDGLTQLLEGLDNPDQGERFWERIITSVAGQYLPGASAGRYAENITDPVEREARNVLERMKLNYPGIAQTVPERRTAFGDVVPRSQTGLEAAVNPIRRSQDREHLGVRRYRGSESAAQDAAIARAITAAKNYLNRPREYPRPTDEQMGLYRRFNGRENAEWTRKRDAARSRARAERQGQTAGRPLAPDLASVLTSALANLPRLGQG